MLQEKRKTGEKGIFRRHWQHQWAPSLFITPPTIPKHFHAPLVSLQKNANWKGDRRALQRNKLLKGQLWWNKIEGLFRDLRCTRVLNVPVCFTALLYYANSICNPRVVNKNYDPQSTIVCKKLRNLTSIFANAEFLPPLSDFIFSCLIFLLLY